MMNWYQTSRLVVMKKATVARRAGRFLGFTTSHTGKMNAKNLGSEMKFPM
jgi:hypothetical protein